MLPAAIVREVTGRERLPHIENGSGDVPRRLHHVGAVKERAVAHHAVVEEPLVPGGGGGFAEILVAEVELDRIELDRRPRPLRLDEDLDALLGLDVHHEPVGIELLPDLVLGDAIPLGFLEEQKRRESELDHDDGMTPRQPLARPQVERHARPPPVLHVELEGGIGLGGRARGHLGLAPIARHRLAVDHAGPVLAAHRTLQDLLGPHGPDRLQHLHLLVADGVGLERAGRLHRDHGHELEHVVLDHVAKHAGGVVVVAAVLDAHLLRHRDLHVVDVAAVPHGLEETVGEAEDHDVLHGLFAEVVVDAVDLPLVEDGAEPEIELARGLEVAAEGLLDDHAPPPRSILLREPGLTEALDDRGEVIGRRGEIEQHVAAGVVGRLDFLQKGRRASRTSPDR